MPNRIHKHWAIKRNGRYLHPVIGCWFDSLVKGCLFIQVEEAKEILIDLLEDCEGAEIVEIELSEKIT